jgi:hypothetical protein
MSDFIINTDDNVYVPAEDSYMLADNLIIEKGQSVLEIGTGFRNRCNVCFKTRPTTLQ